MFSSSSRQVRLVNHDGSNNVYCSVCREYIASTFVQMNTALCELCRRVLNGEKLSNEAITAYRLSKGGKVDVSMLLVEPTKPDQPSFTLRSLTGELLKAIGLKKKDEKMLESVKVVKERKRGRLFAD